jgi:hypothetical protein
VEACRRRFDACYIGVVELRIVDALRQGDSVERKCYRECTNSTKYEAPRDWRPARLLVIHSNSARNDVELH